MFGEIAQGIPTRLNKPSTNSVAYCTGDFTLGLSYTDVPGCSLVLMPGIWFLSATIALSNTVSTHTGIFKMYYGTTDLVAGNYALYGGFNTSNTFQIITTLTAPQTIKLAAKEDGSTFIVRRYGATVGVGGANVPGTFISAFQIG